MSTPDGPSSQGSIETQALTSASPPPTTTSESAQTAAPKNDNFASVFRQVQSGIVRIETLSCSGGGLGTGFLISPTLVVTARHVVENAVSISLSVGGVVATGRVLGTSSVDDLALVETPSRMTGYNFSFTNTPAEIGDDLAAIGFPEGLPISMSTGVVSGLNRTLDIEGTTYTGLLQTDSAINHGNSGGPLVNNHGEVVAIVEAGSDRVNGIGFGLPADRIVEQIGPWQRAGVPLPLAKCGNAEGPSTNTLVELPPTLSPDVAQGVSRAFDKYFGGINTGNYASAYSVLSSNRRSENGYAKFARDLASTYDYNLEALDAKQSDNKTVRVGLKFVSLQAPDKGPDGQGCTIWTLDYRMVLESDGAWHIDRSDPYQGKKYQAC